MSFVESRDPARHLAGFAMVVILHVALVYALINGLARRIVEVVQAPLEVRLLDELKPRVDKPPPPQPPTSAAPPVPFVPIPEVRIETPPESPNAITATSSAKPAAEQPAPHPALAPTRTAAVVDGRNCDKPEYPPASLRAQETGLVVLRFLIGDDGTVIDSKIDKPSGYRRLDEAARKALSLCRFRPGTQDGKPVQSWARIEYLWQLDD